MAGTVHFNRHEVLPLPCLCVKCFRPELTEVEVAGLKYLRRQTTSGRKLLYYWMPAELQAEAKQLEHAVNARLRYRKRRST